MSAREPSPPSLFFEAWRDALCASAALGPVADVACGRGRHALRCVDWGLPTVGLDRDAARLAELRRAASGGPDSLLAVRCDLEAGHEMPLAPGTCGAILVFCFLFRPLAPALTEALAPGGLLLYETFSEAQREVSDHPRNPDFLLARDELPALFPGLEPVAHEEGLARVPRPYAYARLAARRP